MTPVAVTGLSWRNFVQLGLMRKTGADVYAGPGETGAKTTVTLTIVATVGATPAATTYTMDYAFS